MRYTITTTQIAFFRKFGYIEFDNLLTATEIEKISQCIQLKIRQDSFSENLAAGRDVWRSDPYLKEITCNKLFAQIASQLCGKSLRLLFDQILCATIKLLASPIKLEDLSSFQGATIALLLKLTEENEKSADPLFPYLKGSGTFILADHPFNFDHLFSQRDQNYLLIMYGDLKSLYLSNPNDPNTSLLKKWGYGSGDALKEETHPTLSLRI